MSEPRETPLLIVDLDGTVRHGKEELGRFVNTAADVVVFPEALQQLRAWKAKGGRILAASNQGGIALRLVSPLDVVAAIERTNELCEGLFDAMLYCPHHPDAATPRDARCWCRKLAPGMAIVGSDVLGRAEGEFYPAHLALFVGDREEDRECARILNVDFQRAADWRAAAPPESPAPALPAPTPPRRRQPVRRARLRDRPRPA